MTTSDGFDEAASGKGAASIRAAGGKGARRDWRLWLAIAGVVALAVAIVVPVVGAVRLVYQDRRYVQDLASSFVYGEQHSTLTADAGDGPARVSDERAHRLYTLIYDAGMGRPSSDAPEGQGLLLDFGDGTRLELWPADIDGGEGLLLRYERASGDVFSYDTDALRYADVLAVLGLG